MYVHVHAYRMNSTESLLFRQLLCVGLSHLLPPSMATMSGVKLVSLSRGVFTLAPLSRSL